MSKKFFCLALGGAMLLALSFPAQAQEPPKVPRIGFLMSTSPSALSARIEAFRQGLRELGYAEGKNIVVEYRWAEGKIERLPDLAAELVRLKVDVIVTAGPTVTRAAKEATSTIPIVMGFDSDPVGNGFVASLARPGGNITGLSSLAPRLSGKQLEVLTEIVPKLSRVAVFGTSTQPGTAQALRATEPGDIPAVRVGRRRGLMSYGVSFTDLFRRTATYVDKILRGTNPPTYPWSSR